MTTFAISLRMQKYSFKATGPIRSGVEWICRCSAATSFLSDQVWGSRRTGSVSSKTGGQSEVNSAVARFRKKMPQTSSDDFKNDCHYESVYKR
ncbi:hypothetical protein CEXT_302071 [Caerostris extrusa]|uniref:Uncharacterized protein n=1 Tax=Caerostris extrusa TaxID=172846 RepID=A0AAV4VIW0_CAEEX|nr:hypothetical protein CEXT_302071 [Caerostris extrusa]